MGDYNNPATNNIIRLAQRYLNSPQDFINENENYIKNLEMMREKYENTPQADYVHEAVLAINDLLCVISRGEQGYVFPHNRTKTITAGEFTEGQKRLDAVLGGIEDDKA